MANPFKDIDLKIDNEQAALLACIGLSFLIWFFLKLSKEYESDRNIYLKYSLPPMTEFTVKPPSTLVATMHGTGAQLAKNFLLQRHPTISIDLAQFPELEVQSNELIWKIEEETGLAIRKVNRSSLSFSIDSTATKKVPVVLDIELVFGKDFFEYQPLKLSNDSVVLAGPLRELQQINSVQTQRTIFEPIHGNVKKTLALAIDNLKNITILPDKIEVEIFAEQYTEKSLEVPIVVVNAIGDYQLLPTSVTVSCAVGLSNFEELVKDSFLIEVDLTGALNLGEENSIPVNLISSPTWIKSPRLSPKVVEYIIIK